MNSRIQVLFETVATAARSAIMKSIISYMDGNMVPLCYKKPETLPQEIGKVLNDMALGYHIVDFVPADLDEQQLYIDLQMDKSDEMGVVYLRGHFRVFVIQAEEPAMEDVFNIIIGPGSQLEAVNRQLSLYGETMACKLFPLGQKPGATTNRQQLHASLANA